MQQALWWYSTVIPLWVHATRTSLIPITAHLPAIIPGHEHEMQDELPPNEYYEYFGPDYRLHIPPDKKFANTNKRDALEKVCSVLAMYCTDLFSVGEGDEGCVTDWKGVCMLNSWDVLGTLHVMHCSWLRHEYGEGG